MIKTNGDTAQIIHYKLDNLTNPSFNGISFSVLGGLTQLPEYNYKLSIDTCHFNDLNFDGAGSLNISEISLNNVLLLTDLSIEYCDLESLDLRFTGIDYSVTGLSLNSLNNSNLFCIDINNQDLNSGNLSYNLDNWTALVQIVQLPLDVLILKQ